MIKFITCEYKYQMRSIIINLFLNLGDYTITLYYAAEYYKITYYKS